MSNLLYYYITPFTRIYSSASTSASASASSPASTKSTSTSTSTCCCSSALVGSSTSTSTCCCSSALVGSSTKSTSTSTGTWSSALVGASLLTCFYRFLLALAAVGLAPLLEPAAVGSLAPLLATCCSWVGSSTLLLGFPWPFWLLCTAG